MLEFSVFSASIFLIFVALVYYWGFRKKHKNYPPGPIGIPILGNLISLGAAPHLAFQRYAKKYGPVFSMTLGQESAVILHGSKLIKDAFADVRLSGRPDKPAISTFFGGGLDGMVMSDGKVSSDHRRFALRHLRDFGFGKQSMEGLIMDEVNDLLSWIRNQQGKPAALHRRFSLAVVNSLWTILCGQRFEHDDPKLVGILEQLERTANTILGGKLKSLLILFYPKIAMMFPNWSGWNFLLELIRPRHMMFKAAVEEHKATLSDAIPRDYIDAFLQESKNTTDSNSIFYPDNADKCIQAVMAEFFVAGADTTSTTLSWAVLHLLHRPDIQTKIQNEIEEVVGHSRHPSVSDKNNLPYTEGFIMEVLRHSSIVSWGVPRRALADFEINGYVIPEDTIVYPSLYASHHDKTVWGDPQNFRPERFLSPDGTKALRHEALIPFSTGKRACIGETLARDQIFLFVTNILQCFTIVAEEENPKPSLEVNLGQLTLEPYPYVVVLKDR